MGGVLGGAMSMPMGMNGMTMGFTPHSYGGTVNAQYGLAASLQQQQALSTMSFPQNQGNGYAMGSYGNHNTMNGMNGQSAMSLGLTSMDGNQLQHVEEDHEIENGTPKDQDGVSPSESDLRELQ